MTEPLPPGLGGPRRSRLDRAVADLHRQVGRPVGLAQRAAESATEAEPAPAGAPRFVIGVSTFNRLDYLSKFVESFEATRSKDVDWTLVIADDGSTDDTKAFLSALQPDGYRLVIVHNHGARIAGQSNAIFEVAAAIGFDLGFKADDDIFFTGPGWDRLYHEAVTSSSVGHLVYHNADWKPRSHDVVNGSLRSSVSGPDAMGCFYTFTPSMLDDVGLMDEPAFPVRGHAHLDYTLRACRAGYNDAETLWDAAGSEAVVDMWPREDYVDLTDWNSPEIKRILSPQERARRQGILADETRMFLRPGLGDPSAGRSAVEVRPPAPDTVASLEATGRFWSPGPVNTVFDGVFVLNLRGEERRWADTASQLARLGIHFERLPGVAGAREPELTDWQRYHDEGLTHPVEHQIGRKLIQSPGAWGYLRSMERMLELAKKRRLRRVLLLDDDVMFHGSFDIVFERALRELPDAWKLLYLGSTQVDWRPTSWRGRMVYHPGTQVDGSFAVGIDCSVYDLLLDEIRKFEWPFDAGPLREVLRRHPEECFGIFPNLAIPDVSTSTIRGGRDQHDHAAAAKWDLGAYQRRRQIGRRVVPDAEVISVLVPADGDEQGLVDTLESLRLQTHGGLDVVVCVPSGADRLESIAIETARRDPRVRVVRADGDVSDATTLDQLVRLARGHTIGICWPGEVSAAERFERAFAALRRSSAVAAGSPAISSTASVSGRNNGSASFRSLAGGAVRSGASIDLVSRTAFDAIGGFARGGRAALPEFTARLILTSAESTQLDEPGSAIMVSEGAIDTWDADEWAGYHEQITAGRTGAYLPVSGSGCSLTLVACSEEGPADDAGAGSPSGAAGQ